ncbi:MAG TPA: ABC transporter permease [Terriglobales bacterium]|jgi:phospholipid/cholesterol/gamma-HCH transport system permease protein|nr:ABC transporter permease [Terriglobales bacterium]
MPITAPDEIIKDKVLAIQEYSLLAGEAIANLFRRPRYVSDMLMQADFIGVGSLPIVMLTGLSIGAVLALQTSSTLQQFGSISLTGQLVSFSMIKEIGPVLTSLMLAGRAATGMASELGSMKVTEQIDAMRALGTDPVKKLVTPRVISTVIMLFFLSILSDLMGLFGGFIVAVTLLGLSTRQYWTSTYQQLQFADVFQGLCKPFFFGFIIATVGCYYGFSTKGGTQGVGRATTQAMVASSVLILIVDFFITRLLIGVFGR